MTDDTIERARVWPVGDNQVPDEYTGKLIQPGQLVALTRYVLRRIADGSLRREEASAPKTMSGPAKAAPARVAPPPPTDRSVPAGEPEHAPDPDTLDKERI